jgi:hypothetical protein
MFKSVSEEKLLLPCLVKPVSELLAALEIHKRREAFSLKEDSSWMEQICKSDY